MFDNLSYGLTCCDAENADRLYPMKKREWTDESKLWGNGFFRLNIVLLFVNLFFLMLILGWGIDKLVSKNRVNMRAVEN